MNPKVFVIPALLVTSGLVCFFVLPMPLGLRAGVLAADCVAAVVVGLLLLRRLGG